MLMLVCAIAKRRDVYGFDELLGRAVIGVRLTRAVLRHLDEEAGNYRVPVVPSAASCAIGGRHNCLPVSNRRRTRNAWTTMLWGRHFGVG
jgi:hypothetical protein